MTDEVENESKSISLTMKDLAMCVSIIDAACARGAIKGDEMVEVGTTRNKIVQVLEMSKEQSTD